MATFVDTGLEGVAKLTNGVSVDPFTVIALGSGTTAEATDQTALVTELTTNGLAKATATCGYEATGKATWVHTFTSTADSQVINEIAILNTAAAMMMRHKYASAKNLDDTESITVTVTFTEDRA